ncbi:hypothetical protein RQP46_004943 [Phenoliferia psychrophenolica]
MSTDLSFYDSFIDKVLVEPYTYLAAIPGKEVRSALIAAFNLWMNVAEADIAVVKKVVGMLHTASLLMDDVEDDSQLRRGVPVAHKVYGVPQTINSAGYVYFLAFQELQRIQPRRPGFKIEEGVTTELLNLHRGQGMDLFWRENLICPTEPEYIEMVNNKTGGLFRIAIKLMMAASPEEPPRDYVPLANLIGIIFQIRDDYVNLQSAQYAENKGYCEDFTEGKFSFPIVHSIRADSSNRQILNILRERPESSSLKTYAVAYMETKTNSFEYTRNVLAKLNKQARDEVARLGGNPGVEKILDMLEVKEDGKDGARSEFARMAAKIGKDIQGTTFKLEKLAQLAKRKTLFDDRPVEISELTYIIKQDIAHLNQQIAQLQSFTRSNLNSAAGSKQVSEHNNNVVMMLQSKLADASIGFKDVLEIRTQNMKASRDRTEQFMYTGQAQQGPSSDSPLYRAASADPHRKGKGTQPVASASTPAGRLSSDFLALDLGGPPAQNGPNDNGGFMEMQLAQGQGEDQYLNQRSTAIETIESTVAELGQIFSQLATMIAVQGEQVTRIDADTEEIATNVSGAQGELLKYYASISSNRWLMMKVFGVLIAFFLLFGDHCLLSSVRQVHLG